MGIRLFLKFGTLIKSISGDQMAINIKPISADQLAINLHSISADQMAIHITLVTVGSKQTYIPKTQVKNIVHS